MGARVTSYAVYWLESGVAQAHVGTDMIAIMGFSEKLRKRQQLGAPITHITWIGENPDAVGKPGVDVTGPDYDWTKRRGGRR